MKIFDKYIPQFVYGAFDGIVTTFAVVAAASAAGLSSAVVLIFGLANLFADGFSMGASAFLSHQAESKKNRKGSPMRMSLVTFLAFLVVGFIPVAPYFVDVVGHFDFDRTTMFMLSIVITAITFIWVGYAKSVHTKKSLLYSMLETFLLGVVAAGLAYFVGAVLKDIFGV